MFCTALTSGLKWKAENDRLLTSNQEWRELPSLPLAICWRQPRGGSSHSSNCWWRMKSAPFWLSLQVAFHWHRCCQSGYSVNLPLGSHFIVAAIYSFSITLHWLLLASDDTWNQIVKRVPTRFHCFLWHSLFPEILVIFLIKNNQ